MNYYLNKNVLITTQEWFVAPNGQSYKAVWGKLKAVHNVKDLIGFTPNPRHTNWVYEVGNMTVLGCQAQSIIQTDNISKEQYTSYWNGIESTTQPNPIYNANN